MQGVRFRVAFGSDASFNEEGFGFDDVWIGERSRKVLLEHFTNMNTSGSFTADSSIAETSMSDSLDVIGLYYHTNFPGSDVLNSFYPQGPSARAMVYQVSSIPYSVMDGLNKYNWDGQQGSNWDRADLISRSLNDPETQIQLTGQLLNGNQLLINARVDRLDNLPQADQISLYFVVIEQHVEVQGAVYQNVVRKMLPDEGGIQIGNDLKSNGTASTSLNWSFDPGQINADNLKVVAFVQNEQTREVYQTGEINSDILTGMVSPGISNKILINLYPNPAGYLIHLSLKTPVKVASLVQIFSVTGRLRETFILRVGESQRTILLSHYTPGLYFIRISGDGHSLGQSTFSVIK